MSESGELDFDSAVDRADQARKEQREDALAKEQSVSRSMTDDELKVARERFGGTRDLCTINEYVAARQLVPQLLDQLESERAINQELVEILKAEIERLKVDNQKIICTVCWNCAFVPTPDGSRCDYCWTKEQWDAQRKRVEIAERALTIFANQMPRMVYSVQMWIDAVMKSAESQLEKEAQCQTKN